MSSNGAVESYEIERKYEVADGAQLPDVASFASIGFRLDAPETYELRASYCDTLTGELAGLGLALRHRLGGKDEGWHLKARGESGVRELHWPLAETIPEGVVCEIEDRLGKGAVDRLGVIGTLRTQRVNAVLFNESGDSVIELADDRVEGTNELTGRRQSWREWEAELMPGANEGVLDLIELLLIAAGARRVRGASKIQRTMSAG